MTLLQETGERNCLQDIEHAVGEPSNEAKNVLELVNDIRTLIFGWEPISNLPKGKAGDPKDCPIYHALGGKVTIYGDSLSFKDFSGFDMMILKLIFEKHGLRFAGSFNNNRETTKTNTPFGKFVKEVDSGNQPQYISE